MTQRRNEQIPYRHAYLFVALLLLVVLSPFLGSYRLVLVDLFFVLTLGASILSCARRRYQWVVGIGMTALLESLNLYQRWVATLATLELFLGLACVYFLYVIVLVAFDVFQHSSEVSADTIFGALSIYMLIGVGFAFGFALLESLEPGSFHGVHGVEGTAYRRFIGFSYITLTTLGYGNVTPTTERADSLAVLEAILGQVFLTVLVARLVALSLLPQKRT